MGAATEEDERSFQAMWLEARKRFLDLTKRSLTESTQVTLDDAIANFDKKFDPQDPETGGKATRIKELAGNVLKFIQILGGIAAQGASMVFGPATMCFNAVEFLINIPAKISKFHADLDRLFGEISTFMMRFKIYERIEQFTKIDVELKRGTHKMMIVFVDICALSINIFSGSKLRQSKALFKIALFDNDSGVSGKLDEFRQLVAQQSQISDAITLEHVLRSEHELSGSMQTLFATLRESEESSRKLLEERSQQIQDELKETHDDVKTVKVGTETLLRDSADRNAQMQAHEQLETISKQLGIGSDVYENPAMELDQIRSKCLPATGAWLKNLDEHQQWADPFSGAKPLLLLSGDTGVGKSFLMSVIWDELRKKHESEAGSLIRTSLACYYFKKNEKSSRSEASSKVTRPSVAAIKSLVMQIAGQDSVYRKNLVLYLRSKDQSFARDMTAADLAKELLLPPDKGDSTSNMTTFMLFDGFDLLAPEEATQLLRALLAIESVKTRVAIASAENFFHDSLERVDKGLETISTIEIGDHNQEDISHFIDSEIKDSGVLNGDGLTRIVALLRAKLPEIAKGNFESARQIVERVSEAVKEELFEEDIERLIAEDGLKNQQELIHQTVTEYNESLNNQEIEQLNELLLWTIYATEVMSTDEMRAALFMCTKRAPLQSLEDKIREKYYKLLEVRKGSELGFGLNGVEEFDLVCLTNSEIDPYFRGQKREKRESDAEASDDPTISMTITIKNVRLSKVQRFFWDLSEKVVIDKFNFANSLKDFREKMTITSNSAEANLTLTKRCFDLLFDEPKEETKILCRYAMENLMWHLINLRLEIDARTIELSERHEVLSNIISLLQSANSIEQHLQDRFLSNSCWVSEDGGKALQEWLHDSGATDGLNRKDLKWLDGATTGPPLQVLKPIATAIASHWLCNRKWSAQSCFIWIDSFLEATGYGDEPAQATQALQARPEDENVPQPDAPNADTEVVASNEAVVNGINEDIDATEKIANDDENEEEDAPAERSDPDRILRGLSWAATILEMPEEKTSLWYERLGSTYLEYELYAPAKDVYLQAKTLPKSSWRVSEGLAKAYAESDDAKMALQEMDIALTKLREMNELPDDDQAAFVEDLQEAAKWHAKLGESAEAIDKLKEALQLDPLNSRIRHRYLEQLLDAGLGPEAQSMLEEMKVQPAKDENLTQLEQMMLDVLSWESTNLLDDFMIVFSATKGYNTFQSILESLERLIARARGKGRTSDEVDLLLCYGVALQYRSSTAEALKHWEGCCNKGLQARNVSRPSSAFSAARFVLSHHYSQAQASSGTFEDFDALSSSLNQLIEKAKSYPYFAEELNRSLANFHYLAGKQQMARDLLQKAMKDAFAILGDDDPSNDWWGYAYMFQILLFAGEKLDALSAMTLYGPKGRYTVDYEMSMTCDGCKNRFQSSESTWQCCFCDDIAFHRECLDKLQNGTLRRPVCSPNHDWLFVPSWEDEFKETGKGRVRMGGELVDGKRVGGQIVPVEEWLDTVRNKWSIGKPEMEAIAKEVVQAAGDVVDA